MKITRHLWKSMIILIIIFSVNPSGNASSFDPNNLDPTFGVNGTVVTTVGSVGDASSAVLQTDGRIIVAGAADNSNNNDFLLIRYNSNGSLDPSFGVSSTVTTDFSGEYDRSYAVALQQDGKIIVAGYARTYPNSDFALARYTPDGTLDPVFGNDGKTTTDFGGYDEAKSLAIQPDGKIIVVGYTFQPTASEAKIALVRYNCDGKLDSLFGNSGTLTTTIGERSDANAVAIQPDGAIVVVGGTYSQTTGDAETVVVRYLSNGTLDTGFDGDGIVTTNFTGFYDTAYAVALQPDEKIVIAGSAGTLPNTDFMVARYNKDGSLDTGFGNSGKVVTDLTGNDDTAHAIKLKVDGKLLVAGSATKTLGIRDFVLTRYTDDGKLDSTFGASGISFTDLGGDDIGQTIVLYTDGRILLIGTSSYKFAMARYLNDTVWVLPRVWLPVVLR
jgi:uncharacterized delta-60 repeat protein